MVLKRYISLFLLFLISFKLLVVPFVYLDFELRQEYIVKNLCKNRLKPQLHCDGQCYLSKQLNKIAEENARNETQKQSDTFKKIIQEIFDNVLFAFMMDAVFFESQHAFSSFSFFLQKGFISKPVLPPIA